MYSWLRRMSPSPGCSSIPPESRVRVGSPASWNPQFALDPGTWEETFQSHWMQASSIIRISATKTPEHLVTVFKHLDQMVLLLMTEVNAQPKQAIGAILDLFFTDEILDQMMNWCLSVPLQLAPICKINMLRIYESLVTQSHTPHHCLLVHKPILLPLLRLLEWCNVNTCLRKTHGIGVDCETERHFVLLLNQICTKMAEDNTLLEFFFYCSSIEEPHSQRFLVFTLLVPYLYESGDIGQLARDALLLILSVSSHSYSAAKFIKDNSNFCSVLAAGLSGCFSQLPRRIDSSLLVGDDWHGITAEDIEMHPSLTDFYASLLFCNAVVQVGHRLVLDSCLDFIYHGFLVSVVKPALFETGLEEVISAIAYLDLCFRTVAEPNFLRILVHFLLQEWENDTRLLNALVDRIDSTSRLSVVSLGFFQTLLKLHCEDLMLELVFKHLLPCWHLLPGQLPSAHPFDPSFCISSRKLISLVPRCVVECPSELYSRETLASYLVDAGQSVQLAKDRCRRWVFPYDGIVPDPKQFREQKTQTENEKEHSDNMTNCFSSRFHSNAIGLNQYFSSSRHTSCATDDSNYSFSAADLTILDSNFLIDDDDSQAGTPIESPTPIADFESANRREPRSTIDYFKFAFDELSGSDVESSIKAYYKEIEEKSPIFLKGWADLQDAETFFQVLSRVRSSSEATSHSIDENLDFIDSKLQYLNELKTAKEMEIANKESIECEMNARNIAKSHTTPSIHMIGPSYTPCVGPFLAILLRKLDDFLNNTLSVNLQLTAVLSLLACHPQPLLMSFLLNPDLNPQSSVRSLYQILTSLSSKIDGHAAQVPGFDILIERGVKLLNWRFQRFSKPLSKTRRFSSISLESHGFVDEPNAEPRNISDVLHKKTGRFVHKALRENADVVADELRTKNTVFCAIVLAQFLQELAGVVQLHSITI